jgi:hypothetical protein
MPEQAVRKREQRDGVPYGPLGGAGIHRLHCCSCLSLCMSVD